MAFSAIAPFDTSSGFWYAGYSTSNGSAATAGTFTNIGSTEGGWDEERTMHEDEVHDDAWGSARVDTVNQGSEYMISGLMINLNAAKAAGVFDAQAAGGQSNNKVGLLGSSYYGSLCLTPLPGTPNAKLLGTGMSLVYGIAAVANNLKFLKSSKQTKVPVTFKIIPDQNNGNLCYQIVSTPYSLPTAPPI